MGSFKAPSVGAHGARKGAFFMAKELGLEEFFGQGSAVHRHEGFQVSLTPLMQGPCHEFFACTRLARDQHRCIGWPINLNFTQHADKSRCMSQEPVEALRRPDLVCRTGLPW